MRNACACRFLPQAPAARKILRRRAHRRGPVRHKWGTLATSSDVCNRFPSLKVTKSPMCEDRTKSRVARVHGRALAQGEPPRARAGARQPRLLLGVFLPGAEGAGPAASVSASSRQGFPARSHTALLSLYALDSRLARARSELAGLRSRAQALGPSRSRSSQEIEVVEGNLKASQRLLGDRLRTLYEEGEPDAIAVLLGATSLDDAVTRLDELERSARQGAQAATDARDGRAKLRRASAARARRPHPGGSGPRGPAERTATALERARADRVSYLSLARPAAAPDAAPDRRTRLTAPGRSWRRRRRFSRRPPRPGRRRAAPSVADGPRTLTVTSTGYSMPRQHRDRPPGRPGIVAVDPAVIPLGTRLSIPGYGEGVAADTGGAVQGMTIDLWFPTLAEGARLGPAHGHDHPPLNCRPASRPGGGTPSMSQPIHSGRAGAGPGSRPDRRRPRSLQERASQPPGGRGRPGRRRGVRGLKRP